MEFSRKNGLGVQNLSDRRSFSSETWAESRCSAMALKKSGSLLTLSKAAGVVQNGHGKPKLRPNLIGTGW